MPAPVHTETALVTGVALPVLSVGAVTTVASVEGGEDWHSDSRDTRVFWTVTSLIIRDMNLILEVLK